MKWRETSPKRKPRIIKYQQRVLCLVLEHRTCVMNVKSGAHDANILNLSFSIAFSFVAFSFSTVVAVMLLSLDCDLWPGYNKLKLHHRNWASSFMLHFYAIDVYNMDTQTVTVNMLDCWYSTECCFSPKGETTTGEKRV